MLDGIGGEARVPRGPELEFRGGRPECFFGAEIRGEVPVNLTLEFGEGGNRVQHIVKDLEDIYDFGPAAHQAPAPAPVVSEKTAARRTARKGATK